MSVLHDSRAGVLYVAVADAPVARTKEIEARVIVDYDAAGRIVGLEVLEAETSRALAELLGAQPATAFKGPQRG